MSKVKENEEKLIKTYALNLVKKIRPLIDNDYEIERTYATPDGYCMEVKDKVDHMKYDLIIRTQPYR